MKDLYQNLILQIPEFFSVKFCLPYFISSVNHPQGIFDFFNSNQRVSPLSRHKNGLYLVHGLSLHGFWV